MPAPNCGSLLRGLLNGVKHTAESFAALHGLDASELEAAMRGEKPLTPAILDAVANNPPLNVRDLLDSNDKNRFPVVDDTTDGAVIFTVAQREETVRTFERGPADGFKVPYYHYADTAMSRTSLFRPEWIQELYMHDGATPELADWAFNHGHFECQLTYYIGMVNLHWIDHAGAKRVRRTNTGDVHYITPFVPHTFTTRQPGNGLILAVTYGGSLATEQFRSVIADMSRDEFCAEMKKRLPALDGDLPTDALGGIMVGRYQDAAPANVGAYTARELFAGVPFQPWTAVREYTPLSRDKGKLDLIKEADQWGYNVGDSPVELLWRDNARVLQPGDSFFIQPDVPHAFRIANGGSDAKVAVFEIKPQDGEPLADLALIYKYAGEEGLARVHSETQQWF